jgi:choline kinase
MTRAIILAAGTGSRLRPLTATVPKCLLNFQGQSLLQHQLDTLSQAGIEQVTVVGGHGLGALRKLGLHCIENPDHKVTNMVHSLFCARALMTGEEDLIIAYGDIIYQPENLAVVLNTPGDWVLMSDLGWHDYWSARFTDVLTDAESFITDGQGRVRQLGDKVNDHRLIQGQFTGLMKVSAAAVRRLESLYQQLSADAVGGGKLDGIVLIGRPVSIRIGWPDAQMTDDDVAGVLIKGGVQVSDQGDAGTRSGLPGDGQIAMGNVQITGDDA